MTDSYNQENINAFDSPSALEISSRDERQVEALVPAGTTATMQRVRIPGTLELSQLSWAGVVGPGGGESVTLRLFRIRPASNPAGFGFILLNNVFTVNALTFTDPGGNIDISSSIIPGRFILPGEYLACSWVHAGVAVMQPLNMNWNLRPIGTGAVGAEPAPTTILFADVFG
jgi:hypothetical protein